MGTFTRVFGAFGITVFHVNTIIYRKSEIRLVGNADIYLMESERTFTLPAAAPLDFPGYLIIVHRGQIGLCKQNGRTVSVLPWFFGVARTRSVLPILVNPSPRQWNL